MKTNLMKGRRVFQRVEVEILGVVLEMEAAETIGKTQIGIVVFTSSWSDSGNLVPGGRQWAAKGMLEIHYKLIQNSWRLEHLTAVCCLWHTELWVVQTHLPRAGVWVAPDGLSMEQMALTAIILCV